MIRNLLTVLLTIMLNGCSATGGTHSDYKPKSSGNEVAQANLNLAIEYMRRGNFEKSLEKFERAKDADPDYHAVYNGYGLLYQRLGETSKAEKNFKKALKLNKNDSATMNNYGRFLCQSGRYDEAEKIFMNAASNPIYETPEIAITNAGTCSIVLHV